MKNLYFKFKLMLFCMTTLANCFPEKHITVIIPSYNNAACYATNLNSVINQQYSNFDVIYIDDASTDGTGNLVSAFIENSAHKKKFTLIRNKYNRKALANVYKAVYMCADDDLIVILDGDDSFAHTEILSYINNFYAEHDIWFAYAQYKNVPEELAEKQHIPIMGYARPVPNELLASRKYRTAQAWYWSGLYTFYAGLFKKISLKDFIFPFDPYKGKFFPTSKDGAMVYAMMEMCGTHFAHIPEVLLHRNIDTPINDFKVGRHFQRQCGSVLRKIPAYKELKNLDQEVKKRSVEAFVFPEIRMMRDLFELSLNKKRNISINTRELEDILRALDFDIMRELKELCNESTAEYIFLSCQKTKALNVELAIDLLIQTGALCLLSDTSIIRAGVPIARQPVEHLEENIYAICTEYTPLKLSESTCGIFKRSNLLLYIELADSLNELDRIIYNTLIAKNNLVLISC